MTMPDSESPPPRRSRARPTSASYGYARHGDEALERPRTRMKSLWTPDQDAPSPRSSVDPNKIASHQTMKSRSEVLRKSKDPSSPPPKQAVNGRNQAKPPPSFHPNNSPILGHSPILGRSSRSKQLHSEAESFDIVMQPETRPISQEQLVAEVKGSKFKPGFEANEPFHPQH